MSTPSSPRRVAVATKNRSQIDLHFGHADAFSIYAVDAGKPVFFEQRLVEHYCQGGDGDEDKRAAILRAIADCEALFAARIGDGPKTRLANAGIAPVDDYPYGEIEASIRAWLDAGVPPALR